VAYTSAARFPTTVPKEAAVTTEGNCRRLEGKVAIITGAGRGIGYAYAERFLREGASVVVAELNPALAEDAASSLAKLGPVHLVATDVADEASGVACAAATVEHFGRLDALVNNAGLYGDMDMADQSLDYLRKMFDINLHGSWLMARAVAPHMVRGGGGRIVNVASGAAYNYKGAMAPAEFAGVQSFAYPMSKWGVVGLTKYLAGSLGRYNITVNCIAPGVVMSDATKSKISDEIITALGREQPLPGQIQPEDVAGTAVFFVSDDARFISGQVLVIDGGRHMPA
jgi:NAD(P)-dependent dehydrogenase (short-subunit alcohol dehydrogenase family)